MKVDHNYCNYLRKYDSKVMYNDGIKELRPYIGILFVVNNCEYFAPLCSPKEKHKRMSDQIDMIKISNGELGVINLNNMIPVLKDNYTLLDLNKKSTETSVINRLNLLKSQLIWLNSNHVYIIKKALVLYNNYKNNNLPNRIRNRCCNYGLLEQLCIKYNKKDLKC